MILLLLTFLLKALGYFLLFIILFNGVKEFIYLYRYKTLYEKQGIKSAYFPVLGFMGYFLPGFTKPKDLLPHSMGDVKGHDMIANFRKLHTDYTNSCDILSMNNRNFQPTLFIVNKDLIKEFHQIEDQVATRKTPFTIKADLGLFELHGQEAITAR